MQRPTIHWRRQVLETCLTLMLLGRIEPAQSGGIEHHVATGGQDIAASVQEIVRAASKTADWEQGTRRLYQLSRGRIQDRWIQYGLCQLVRYQNKVEAKTHCRDAAEGFSAFKEYKHEVDARLILTELPNSIQETRKQLDLAKEAAERSGDDLLLTTVNVRIALTDLNAGKEVLKAYQSLLKLESQLRSSERESVNLHLRTMIGLGHACRSLGWWKKARSHYLQSAEEALEKGQGQYVAVALYSAWLVLLDDPRRAPDQDQLIEETKRVLEVALDARYPGIEVPARRVLGRLLPGSDGILQLRESCRRAVEIKDDRQLSYSLQALAAKTAEEEPEEAQRWLHKALRLVLDTNDTLTYGWGDRMTVRWLTMSKEQAFEDSLQDLNAIESTRNLQSEPIGRRELFSVWVPAYQWLIGHALREAVSGDTDIWAAKAFDLIEHIRARVLLEQTSRQCNDSQQTPSDELKSVRDQIANANRRLLFPDTSAEERGRIRRLLDDLKDQEEELREGDGGPCVQEQPSFARLSEAREALSEREALLIFQTSPEKDVYGRTAGGSWVLVVTSSDVWVHELPEIDLEWLDDTLKAYLDFVEQKDKETEARRASKALYKFLFGLALERLPKEVSHLILIPDAALQQLPFAGLREVTQSPTLAGRFLVYQVPSASLWLKWRKTATASGPALVLADPTPSTKDALIAAQQRALNLNLDEIGPLPNARKEGHSVVRLLGRSTRLLVDRTATEAYLKENDLRGFPVIHFAAHAFINGEDADQSFVWLAQDPGGAEDGRLTASEISKLELKHSLVVLAACHSATGRNLPGEGVIGLAYSFFEAGAQAVIGSLWAVSDEDGARFFTDFYQQLAQGRSAAEALQAVQSEWSRRGEPEASWAGYVLFGNGDLSPAAARAYQPALIGWIRILLGTVCLAWIVHLGLRMINRGASQTA